jgi:hypothetical protein
VQLCELMFATGNFPSAFKLAVVCPIHKGGSKLCVDNYRPIAILPILSRIVEKVVHQRLSDYFCKELKTLYSHQFGFRVASSTENATIELTNLLLSSVDRGMCASGVFMDLRKAFDVVDHNYLLEVLQKYGVRGVPSMFFANYLQERRQVVKVNGKLSQSHVVTHGVVQGSCLGPLLLLIFMNAVGSLPLSGQLFLYADDALLINIHDPKQSDSASARIRGDMSMIVDLFCQRGLLLNESKTKFVMFGSAANKMDVGPTIEISPNLMISRVDSIIYLGLGLHEYLRWNFHVSLIEKKVSPANGILWKLRNVLPLYARKLVYDSLLQSHLNYVIPVWGHSPFSTISLLQVLQNRALRNVYHLKPRTNRVNMYLHMIESHLPIRGIFVLNTATYLYKSINNFTFSNLVFSRSGAFHTTQTRSSSSLRSVIARSSRGAQSISTVGPTIFNKIPEDIKRLRHPQAFRWALRCFLRNENFISSCFDSSYFNFVLS